MEDPSQVGADPFEREKWEADHRLREREVALKEREAAGKDREHELKVLELDAKVAERERSKWTNPLVLAVLASRLGCIGQRGSRLDQWFGAARA